MKNLEELVEKLAEEVDLDRSNSSVKHYFSKNELQHIITAIRTLKKLAYGNKEGDGGGN